MGLLLYTSQHSFFNLSPLNVEEAGCQDVTEVCLPVYSLSDLQFQIIADVSGDDKDWFEQEVSGSMNTVKAGVCSECPDVEGEEPTSPAAPIHWASTWTRISTDAEGSDVWVGTFSIAEPAASWGIEVGECFKICLYRIYGGFSGDVTIKLACTNYCFQRINDPCYTSVVKYRCAENAYGFYYTGHSSLTAFHNHVRLPMFLKNMQLPKDQKSYRKSNGQFMKLYERVDEEYDVSIEYMPKHFHKKVMVALGHDVLKIKNTNETENSFWDFVCEEAYDIKWQIEEELNAPASTKIKRSESLIMTNSNCN